MDINCSDYKEMNECRNKILSDPNFCYGWCVTYNADPCCIETEEQIKDFQEEVEGSAIVEIYDPEDREIALERLNAEGYEGKVYQVGGATFIMND